MTRAASRILLATAVLAGATLLGGGPGRAYDEGRYCAVVDNGSGSTREICEFDSFEACRLEAISGNRGYCNDNPRWLATKNGSWNGYFADLPSAKPKAKPAQ